MDEIHNIHAYDPECSQIFRLLNDVQNISTFSYYFTKKLVENLDN